MTALRCLSFSIVLFRAGQWAALLEVEANGGVIPDALRKKLGGAASSSEEPDTKPTTSTAQGKGSRKKAAKRARKAAKKTAGRPLDLVD
jgi:hypothetical protein